MVQTCRVFNWRHKELTRWEIWGIQIQSNLFMTVTSWQGCLLQ
jgi:hypothetical protein